MDLFVWSLLVALVCIFCTLSMKFIFCLAKNTTHHDNSIPVIRGSTGWPIIGESLRFVSSGYKSGKPESFIRERMSKYSSDVFKTSIAGSEMAVLCGVGGNKTIFSNDKNIIGIWWPSTVRKIMVSKGSSIGDEGKVRELLSPFLKPDALRGYIPIMDDMMKEFMTNNLVTNQIVHSFPVFKKLAFSLGCKLFLRTEDPVQVDKLGANLDAIMQALLAVPVNFPGTLFNRAIKTANKIREELYPIIEQKILDLDQNMKPNGHDHKQDLISFLIPALSSTQNKEMLLKEIADAVLCMLVASHETTGAAISFVMYYLAENPHVYEQVFKEQNEIRKSKKSGELLNWDDINKMNYSRCVLNEVLRLAPPVPGTFREAMQDFTFAGFTIPKGRKLYWSVHSTHKDPKYFENPEEFNPSRFEGKRPEAYAFVPFGSGRFMCPGNGYARIEILIFIHNMITRFRWNNVLQNEKFINDSILFPTQGLPVQIFSHDDDAKLI